MIEPTAVRFSCCAGSVLISVAESSLVSAKSVEVLGLDGVAATAVWLEPDIVWFEVAVDDACSMCCFHRGANLFQNIDDPRDWKCALLGHDIGQRTAVQVFHDKIGNWSISSLREAEIGDVDNVRMSQAAGCFCFAAKARHKLIVS